MTMTAATGSRDSDYDEFTIPDLKAQHAQFRARIQQLTAQRGDVRAQVSEQCDAANSGIASLSKSDRLLAAVPTTDNSDLAAHIVQAKDRQAEINRAVAEAEAAVDQEIAHATANAAGLWAEIERRRAVEAAADGKLGFAESNLLKNIRDGFGIIHHEELIANYVANRHRFPGAPKTKEISGIVQVLAMFAIAENILPVMTEKGPEDFVQLCTRLSIKQSIPDSLRSTIKSFFPRQSKRYGVVFVAQMLGIMRTVPDGLATAADLAPERMEVVREFMDAVRCAYQAAGIDVLDPALRPDAAPASYKSFVAAWYAKLDQNDTANPYVGSFFQKSDDSNKQSLWCSMFGPSLTREQQKAWTAALASASPSLEHFDRTKGSSPIGTTLGHVERAYFDATLGFFLKFINCHDQTFTMEGKVDDTSVYQVGKSLPIIYGLGRDAVRLYFARLGQMLSGVDYLATEGNADGKTVKPTSDATIDEDAMKARREFGVAFGVLRLDWRDALKCCQETGVFPEFMPALLYLHLAKYVRIDGDDGDRLRLRITYRDRDSTIDVRCPSASLSTGVKLDAGNGPIRVALTEHLGLLPHEPEPEGEDDDEIPEWYQRAENLINHMFNTVRPMDFPQVHDPNDNPLLLVPPAVVLESYRDRTEYGLACKPWLDVRVACRGYLLFDPASGRVSPGYTTPAATIHLSRPTGSFTESAYADFIASMPEKVPKVLPSAIARRFAPNRNDLGELAGCDIAWDVVLLSDLIRAFFPHTKIGKLLIKEILLVAALPSDVSDSDLASNVGKSKHLLPLARACCLALKITPPPDGGNAVAQRTLVDNFIRDAAATFFLDDFVWPKSQGHFLHETKLRVIATSGIGQSPGQAYENASNLYFRHHLFMTLKTVIAVPDIRNRMIVFFYDVFTDANRLSNADITFIESEAYPWTLRLAALRWLFSPEVQALIPTLEAVDGPLRFKGISSVAKLVCQVTNRPYESFERYLSLCSAKLEEHDVAGDESGVSALQGDSVRAFVPFFERASTFALSALAAKMVGADANRGVDKLDTLKAIIANEGEYWQAAKHAGIENDGHANLIAGKMSKAAAANLLVRPDGWSLILRKVHLASGAPKARVYLVHETDSQGEFSLAKWEQRFAAWKAARAGGSP